MTADKYLVSNGNDVDTFAVLNQVDNKVGEYLHCELQLSGANEIMW